MADFINLNTFEIKKSVHTPNYINNPDWANINHNDFPKIDLPICDKKYWKRNGNKIVEMNKTEKENMDKAIEANIKKTQEEILIQDKIKELTRNQAIDELKKEGKI